MSLLGTIFIVVGALCIGIIGAALIGHLVGMIAGKFVRQDTATAVSGGTFVLLLGAMLIAIGVWVG